MKTKGLNIILTGNGKGKTTSALGMILRALGNDQRVCMIQFIKSPESEYGEKRMLDRMGLRMVIVEVRAERAARVEIDDFEHPPIFLAADARLPDVIVDGKPGALKQLADVYAETGGNVVAAMEVPAEKTSSYGVLDIEEDMGSMVKVKGMVEKPKAEDAPSNLAVIGRYILTPKVMQNLNKKKEGAGGEIQLTDAIAEEIVNGNPVYGFRFRGQRYDCGSKAGFLQATVAFGLARPDLNAEFSDYLDDLHMMRQAAQ